MKRDRAQQRLDQLRSLRSAPVTPQSREIIASALADASNVVAARAAALVEELQLRELTTDLLTAFGRFLGGNDKACDASNAIAKALYALDFTEPEPYLLGVHHVQMEGSYGPPVDAAAELRGVCAMGLAQTKHDGVLEELAVLLNDAWPGPRLAAAKAIGCCNQAAGIPLLLFKVLIGDKEPDVITECLISLLALSIPRTLTFVAEQLSSHDDARAESAAIALGAVRDDRAFEVLRAKWDATAFGEIRGALLTAMASSRNERAIQFLVSMIASEPVRTAAMAVKALGMHRHDERIRTLVQNAAAARPELAATIRAEFG